MIVTIHNNAQVEIIFEKMRKQVNKFLNPFTYKGSHKQFASSPKVSQKRFTGNFKEPNFPELTNQNREPEPRNITRKPLPECSGQPEGQAFRTTRPKRGKTPEEKPHRGRMSRTKKQCFTGKLIHYRNASRESTSIAFRKSLPKPTHLLGNKVK